MKITINGKIIESKPEATVLEAALSAGIYIPNLCYHPDLPPIAVCRLCIVEIEGMRGFSASCTTRVKEAMVVRTDSDKIQKLRRYILWLMLSEHPKDLIESSQFKKVLDWVGLDEALPHSFLKSKNIPVISEEPLFIRDLDRCILCGRCVRICQDIRGIGAIGLAQRGIDTIVSTGFSSSLKDSGCKFCRACVEVCPSGALVDKEVYLEDERDRKLLPCNDSCPAGIDVARYLRLIAEGKFQDSLEVIREKVPFPHVLGCVCTHPCENACFRGEVNEPIAIRALKRFVAELDSGRWRSKITAASDTGKKVAVVGSGPCGLTAAWFLKKQGHSVTVFESFSQAGGMMRTAIPKYRLPRDILDKEIEDIINLGVELKINTEITSLDELFREGFNAVFVATGASCSSKMGIPGEDDVKVLEGLALLKAINCGGNVDITGDIAVVGGGNVAIDVARSVLRAGAKSVTVLYRRTRNEMPALEEEIEEALEEGVKIDFLITPQKVLPEKNKLGIECIRMQLGEPDASGRRRPVPIEGSEEVFGFDRMVIAIGQKPLVDEKLSIALDKKGYVVIEEETFLTSIKNVFSGGDVVTGPDSVIGAIQAGRCVARSIDKYLGGEGEIEQKFIPDEEESGCLGREDGFAERKRVTMDTLAVKKRISGFSQVECGFDEEKALKEAKRCLRCQLRLTISKASLPPKKNNDKK
ncbi:MAG: FAD-dependent oxidoreductase [Candidatus Saelkia tenebricola]|nr:FAD-dependent oxidoreductase [Candidatus Saelkia tenebricola]